MREKCLGIMGLLFGHQFVTEVGGYVFRSDYCFRCGYKRGC